MDHDYEIEALNLFVSRIDRMQQYQLSKTLSSDKVSSFSVAYDLNNQAQPVHYPQLPLDQRDAFALSLRLFMQDNDEISIRRISELINGLPLPDQFITMWNGLRQRFNEYLDSSPDRTLEVETRRALVETFLYGDLLHMSQDDIGSSLKNGTRIQLRAGSLR